MDLSATSLSCLPPLQIHSPLLCVYTFNAHSACLFCNISVSGANLWYSREKMEVVCTMLMSRWDSVDAGTVAGFAIGT